MTDSDQVFESPDRLAEGDPKEPLKFGIFGITTLPKNGFPAWIILGVLTLLLGVLFLVAASQSSGSDTEAQDEAFILAGLLLMVAGSVLLAVWTIATAIRVALTGMGFEPRSNQNESVE